MEGRDRNRAMRSAHDALVMETIIAPGSGRNSPRSDLPYTGRHTSDPHRISIVSGISIIDSLRGDGRSGRRAGRSGRQHRLRATDRGELPQTHAARAGPGLLVEPGFHRHRPDNLRSVVAIRLAAEAPAGNGG